MPENQPVIIDLGMSDAEYLHQLACGIDPVQEYCQQSYQTVLMSYGIPATSATRIAPLIDKLDASIEEKLQVNRALKAIWYQLTGQRQPRDH
jgi:hypothetical protein